MRGPEQERTQSKGKEAQALANKQANTALLQITIELKYTE